MNDKYIHYTNKGKEPRIIFQRGIATYQPDSNMSLPNHVTVAMAIEIAKSMGLTYFSVGQYGGVQPSTDAKYRFSDELIVLLNEQSGSIEDQRESIASYIANVPVDDTGADRQWVREDGSREISLWARQDGNSYTRAVVRMSLHPTDPAIDVNQLIISEHIVYVDAEGKLLEKFDGDATERRIEEARMHISGMVSYGGKVQRAHISNMLLQAPHRHVEQLIENAKGISARAEKYANRLRGEEILAAAKAYHVDKTLEEIGK